MPLPDPAASLRYRANLTSLRTRLNSVEPLELSDGRVMQSGSMRKGLRDVGKGDSNSFGDPELYFSSILICRRRNQTFSLVWSRSKYEQLAMD